MKVIYLFLGLISLLLATLGVILPLLPTVPFLLLSAFFFARSSERLHRWLMEHRVFGPLILDWQQHGAISPRAKKAATVSIAAVFTISLVLQVPAPLLLIQAAALSLVTLFIWSRPNG
ncbi:YbaN family protein [Tritonibacter horizontis]|uniref:Inner membrane protein YbaN n=1 Tax=Tritonibacter horizontis TaxID=1768241 RepID=A0A132C3Q6_9RHOB|nr:YbaN family protein [Tritonibacter horizontis]KUP94822.1 inner membrane protein YbaN [Tritonibacter horizontis]